jgi:hypothetical protein
MVVVGVGVHDNDGKRREFAGDFANVADAHAGVEKEAFVFAKDEVGDGLFGLVRFVDGDGVGRDSVDFKPGIGNGDALKRFVFGAGKRLAPVRDLRRPAWTKTESA